MKSADQGYLPLVMIGAGGHARVLHALALAMGAKIVGVCDPALVKSGLTDWQGVPVLGGDEALDGLDPAKVGVINGVGQLVGSRQRQIVYERIVKAGFRFVPLIHPYAWVAETARLEDGVQVMAGAIIQPGCTIGANTIINTKSSIDHDCVIGAHVHIAPGATLCGDVKIGDGAFVGSGATIIQQIEVGAGAIVGAGTTLTKNLANNEKVLGASSQFVSRTP